MSEKNFPAWYGRFLYENGYRLFEDLLGISRYKGLNPSQVKNFRLFQSKSLQTTISNLMENGRKIFQQVENTVEKGKIARYEQYLLFPQCF